MAVIEACERAGAEEARGGAPFAVILGLAAAGLSLFGPSEKAAAQGYTGGPNPATATPQQGIQNPFGPPATTAPQQAPQSPFGPPATTAPQPGLQSTFGPPGAPAQPVAQPPPLVITPSLDVQTTFTDNALSTPSQKQSDVYFTVSPALFATEDSARLNGVFNYSPQAIEHVAVSSQDQIIQNLLMSGTATVVPERFFFDAHASMSDISRTGARGFGNPTEAPSSTSTHSTAYSGSPYAQFHFGPVGDAEVRYIFSQTLFSGNTAAIGSTVPGQAVGGLSSDTQNEGKATFVSGEILSRLQLNTLLDYQKDDTVSVDNSTHAIGTVGGSYALYPTFDLIANGGYERLNYPNQPATGFSGNYDGATYQGGFHYHPRDDRSITLQYGKTEGQNTLSGNASWAATPLLTLTASYSAQTQTEQQSIQQNLGLATQTTPGQTINQQTGLPLSLTNPNLSLQNEVTRTKTLDAGVMYQYGQRNRYIFQFTRTELGVLAGGASSQTTDGGILTWQRDLSPDLTGNLSGGYSATVSQTTGTLPSTSEAVTATVSFNYALTDTLFGTASYSLVRQSGVNGVVLVDLATVGLHKNF